MFLYSHIHHLCFDSSICSLFDFIKFPLMYKDYYDIFPLKPISQFLFSIKSIFSVRCYQYKAEPRKQSTDQLNSYP